MLVKGGPANSGSKRALRERPREAWTCACGIVHRAYMASCSKCRTKRGSLQR